MGCVSGQVGWWGLDRQARHLGCPDASEPQNNIVNVSVKKQEAWLRHTQRPWEVGAVVQTRGNKDLSQDRNKG